ncbi:MAG: type I methionyl aminopeptidase [Legionella sp.]|jgi:methionyl aminopeptidase
MLVKSYKEIQKMRIAGKMTALVLEMIEPHVIPGTTTRELDRICHEFIVNELRAIPSTLNHHGFPASICTSVNHVVCHGIPNDKKLVEGDIINIDVTVKNDGYIGDSSKMFLVGEVKPFAKRLIEVTRECLYKGIGLVRPGTKLGDIGHVIQVHAEKSGYSVVREFAGHGIGRTMWEEPQVLHYGKPNSGFVLQTGMTFTIEPMINLGRREIKTLSDGWTVVTKDRRLSAQWEHTILVTETGHEILTLRTEENI